MMYLNLMLHFAFVALAPKVRAQDVYYITLAVTECFPVAPYIKLMPQSPEINPSSPVYQPLPPTNSSDPDVPKPPGSVIYSMPPCAVCDCPTCTATSVFETTYPDFNTNGPTERPYTVTEIYVGMSSLPYFPTPTTVPYGFITTVETCTDCGAQPTTRTVVMPKTGRPLGQGMPGARESPGTQPYGTPSPTSIADLPPRKTTHAGIWPVETTFTTSTGHDSETTQAGGQGSEVWDGEAITRGPSAVSPSYIHVSAGASYWGQHLLLYGAFVSTFWVVTLFQ